MSTTAPAGRYRHSKADGARVRLGRLLIDTPDLVSVSRQLRAFADSGKPHHVITANLQFATLARNDRAFSNMVNEADLVVADGMPLVWMSKLQGTPVPTRVTGHDLLHLCASLSASNGYTMFFLGGAPGAARIAAERLRETYPGVRIAGTHEGRFNRDGFGATEEEERQTVEIIRRANPHFLFVALGCPKQEMWIRRHRESVGAPVSVGVGCVLDVTAGMLDRAPAVLQKTGLEWFYRMSQEPGRLWKRYLLGDIPTATGMGFAALARRAGLRSREPVLFREEEPAADMSVDPASRAA
jgi:N-acetylglucosaminyldiphosphoundecaprenol N-acetyl-beta-D-mannosaminyltransferase